MQAEQKVEANPTDRPIFKLPVDTRILFSNHRGVHKPSLERRRTKLLGKLGFLANFLDADEKIAFVTTGCSPFTLFEQLTFGALWVILLKRAVFVFTNKRVLHIPTTWTFQYRGSIAQILYQDCRRLRIRGSRLVAEYRNGKKEKFLYIPRCDRKVIKQFQFSTNEFDELSDNPQRHHLCPKCTQVQPAEPGVCPACGLEFRNRAICLTRSVLIPGGGYFYAKHPLLGVSDALGEAYLLFLTLMSLGVALLGNGDAMFMFFLFLGALTIEKLVTIRHANSFLAEFIPRDGGAFLTSRPAPKRQTEQAPAPAAPPEPRHRPEDILSVR